MNNNCNLENNYQNKETNVVDSKLEVQNYILELMSILKNIVGATMGPKGSYSLGNFDNNISIINDGATIINNIKFNGKNAKFYNLILERIKTSTQNVNEQVGDGTSTCLLMISSLFEIVSSYSRIDNPILLGKGMELALERILEFISKNNNKVLSNQDIIDIAKISSRSLKIGEMIGEAMKQIGQKGNIICSEGNTTNTILEINKGFKIESGVISSSLLQQKLKLNLKFPLVFITDYVLSSPETIFKILELSHSKQLKNGGDDNLIIIAKDIKGSALKILLAVAQQKNIIAIKSPSFGDEKILRDICALTNSKFVSQTDSISLENMDISVFGQCNDLETSLNSTTFVVNEEFNSESIKERINFIEKEIEQENDIKIISQLKERISRLTGGVANIKVGGINDKNIKDQTYLVQDAISAVQAAIEKGFVVGGGMFYMNIAEDLKDFLFDIESKNLYSIGVIRGIKSVIEALYCPLKMIISSTDLSFDLAMKELGVEKFDILQKFNLKTNYGFNADTLEFCDLLKNGVKEPAKVSEQVLINAVSLVSALLNTHSMILKE